MKKQINSLKEMADFAKEYARALTGGEAIGLIGNLGAGKTTFTKALAKSLGIKKNITSPTFVLMKVYPVKYSKLFHGVNPVKQKNIKTLVHIDAYRLKSFAGLEAIGASEYLNDKNAVVLIEWADKIKKDLPRKTKFITIKNKGEKTRIINY